MRKILFEEALLLLQEKHGDKIKLLEYVAMGKNAKFECCVCGNIWETLAHGTIVEGRGCRKCSSKITNEQQKTPLQDIKNKMEKMNCELLSEYKNCYTNLIIKYSCGHIGKQIWINFLKGNGVCQDCNREAGNDKKRKDVGLVQEEFEKAGFKFLGIDGKYHGFYTYVFFECEHGHISRKTIARFRVSPFCIECSKINGALNRRNDGNGRWKGGNSFLTNCLKNCLNEWKMESSKSCEFKCCISGYEKGWQVHHLYGFNLILKEALNILNIKRRKSVKDYTEEDILKIEKTIKELHNNYPLGVCLNKKLHKMFHKIYGYYNNTPDQFYEFMTNIKLNQLVL